MVDSTNEQKDPIPKARWKVYTRNTAYILLALVIFLFALDLMISSFQLLGKTAAEAILLATANPFTALFIGLLITAIIQSSSASTSMVVALVASGSLSLQSAIPIIMGANIGTTITSTIVSLGFISKKKEFTRAVAAGTYHDFFNILTAAILFPIEYYYGFLSQLSQQIATTLFNQPVVSISNNFSLLGSGFNPLINFLVQQIDSGFVLVLISFSLLFGSILFFRKVLTDILGLDSQKSFQFYFFKNPVKAFGSGLIATATIRSSTITTSLVVPFVAKKLIPLRDAAPFILGANIGTTVTAFIAAAFNSNSAISIAVAHFLFNLFGVVLFLFPPYLKEVPLRLALGLGKLTRKYRLIGLLYILMVFFIIPFSLIYLHKDQTSITELTYEKINHSNLDKSDYILIIRDRKRNGESTWMIYDKENKQNPNKIISVLSRGNILFINDEIYEFGSPGFCRTNPRNGQPYEVCVEKVIPSLYINTTKYDSVYVFNLFPVSHQAMDSTKTTIYFSRTKNFPLKKERFDKDGSLLESEELVAVEIK